LPPLPTLDHAALLVRHEEAPSLFAVDPRRYRRHRGALLVADRVYVRGMWTPLVRVRARVARASDGGGEW
jgi:hypothetical protein